MYIAISINCINHLICLILISSVESHRAHRAAITHRAAIDKHMSQEPPALKHPTAPSSFQPNPINPSASPCIITHPHHTPLTSRRPNTGHVPRARSHTVGLPHPLLARKQAHIPPASE
nr:RcOsp4 [Ceratobasidium cereale]